LSSSSFSVVSPSATRSIPARHMSIIPASRQSRSMSVGPTRDAIAFSISGVTTTISGTTILP
jgi:hypothetical protein